MSSSRPQCRASDSEAIEATAAAWLAQRDDGLTAEQAAEFARWRATDVRHEAAVVRLESTWTALQQLRDFRPEARRHPDRDLLRETSRRRRVSAWPALAMAASILLLAGWWLAGVEGTGTPARDRIATSAGDYQRVTLEDGSMVELNGSTEVRVQYTAAVRRVRLVQGEAHFTVAKNPARPFLVEAGAVAVKAVGTAFNVRLDKADIEVLVTQGAVEVAEAVAGGVDNATRWTEREQTSPVVEPTRLTANERVWIPAVRVEPREPTPSPVPVVEKVAPAAIREALAWQGPRLVFVDTPLGEAIAQFNRRTAIQIELADHALATLSIGGSFRAENVEGFVRLITSGGDIMFERPEQNRFVLRAAR